MQLGVEYTTQFRKDLKKAKRCGKSLNSLRNIMKKIEFCEDLSEKLRDHKLIGNWSHHRELHIENDWLLIYRIKPSEKIVIFVRLGSHSELFY